MISGIFWKDKWGSDVASVLFPRAFSYALIEDVSAADFLSATTLSANFALPLSAQALQEVRMMQQVTADIVLDSATHDQWTYTWGAEKYTSRQYYKFCLGT